MASLGKRISESRKRKNMTQDQMAAALGVSNQAVSKWENDISCPDISILPELADFLGVSIDVLLRGERAEVVKYEPETAEDGFTDKLLKVRIVDGEDKVSINLPLALYQLGLVDMSSLNINGLKGIDFDSVLALASKGVIGKILEIESEDETVCEIYIE